MPMIVDQISIKGEVVTLKMIRTEITRSFGFCPKLVLEDFPDTVRITATNRGWDIPYVVQFQKKSLNEYPGNPMALICHVLSERFAPRQKKRIDTDMPLGGW